jgi:hypothetical protein
MKNKLLKFTIISERNIQALEDSHDSILLSVDHIVSVKPIRIVSDDKVLKGYWVRMSNGKKYRAIEVPKEIAELMPEFDIEDDS